ncbi:MAG TPA: hypothetical protein VLX58_13910 [Bryobacteraceae bacterium]|nr:hypothetical protein [Bryobacteraceae bacterium]
MSLPDTIRVKLSSEAAEYVSLTPVVVREMPTRELVEHMLGVTGKDEARIRDLLLRGTLVSGASRFRWNGWDAGADAVRALLATFPDAEPGRTFAAGSCVRAVLRGPRQPIDIPRDVGSGMGLVSRVLRRSSFWNLLLDIAEVAPPRYAGYSYRDHADIYQVTLSSPEVQRIRDASRLVRYTALQAQIRNTVIESADFYVVREDMRG